MYTFNPFTGTFDFASIGALDARYVNVTGDTMTGALSINGQHIFPLTGEVVLNETGIDLDFRVEGDSVTSLLHVDASADMVGIGTATPAAKLHVATGVLRVSNNGNADIDLYGAGVSANRPGFSAYQSQGTIASPTATLNNDILLFFGGRGYGDNAYASSSTGAVAIRASENWTNSAQGTRMTFETTPIGSTTRLQHMILSSEGALTVNEQGRDADFRVEGDTNVNLIFADASADKVGIGTSAPSTLLHVGLAGTTLGTIGVAGNTSGLVTIQPAAAAGTWTLTLPTTGGTNDYALTTNGSGVSTWAAIVNSITGTANQVIASAATGAVTLSLDATLAALGTYNTNGLLTQTAADTFTGRTITGTADKITVTNGDGVSGNPTLTVAATYVGQTSITTLGTIATGTWSATTIAVNKGGTGQTSYTNGQLLIGNTTGNTLDKATLTGTANQVVVTNGGGSITLSLPQSIATTSDVQFGTLTLNNTGLHLLDTNATHDLIIAPGSNLTADHTLTLTTGDADRTITINGNPTLNDWFDQSVKTTTNPTFASVKSTAGTTSSRVGTTETTTSTSYTDLATAGPSVSISPGITQNWFLFIQSNLKNSADGNGTMMAPNLNGGEQDQLSFNANNQFITSGAGGVYNVTSGSTATAKYKVGAGTGTFEERKMTVVAV